MSSDTRFGGQSLELENRHRAAYRAQRPLPLFSRPAGQATPAREENVLMRDRVDQVLQFVRNTEVPHGDTEKDHVCANKRLADP